MTRIDGYGLVDRTQTIGFTFDGVQKQPCGNRITIGYGRDAADVALTSNYGALELTSMKVTVEKAP